MCVCVTHGNVDKNLNLCLNNLSIPLYMCVCHSVYVSYCLCYCCSDEQVSQLTKELNTERERVSMSEANTSGEASNLSFEMSEADL